jgi:hypothetical protein
MKLRHIISLSIILLCLAGCGDNSLDKWQALSSQVYRTSPVAYTCRHRCSILAKQMIESEKVFDLVFGTPIWDKKAQHIRIEYWSNGEMVIIDPMWKKRDYHKFIETDRWEYVPDREDNIRVVSFVNRMLSQIGEKPYRR